MPPIPFLLIERGKDMDTFDKVPSTRGKSYYNKQERDWWHQANLPEKLDYDYSEMESTPSFFIFKRSKIQTVQ
jgi:hypothetical protein